MHAVSIEAGGIVPLPRVGGALSHAVRSIRNLPRHCQTMGVPVTINLATGTTCSIDTAGFMLPSGLNFTSATDLMVGQKVRLHPTAAPTGTPPNLTITV